MQANNTQSRLKGTFSARALLNLMRALFAPKQGENKSTLKQASQFAGRSLGNMPTGFRGDDFHSLSWKRRNGKWRVKR